MIDQKIEKIIEQIKKRLINLQERKFHGKITIDVDYKDGGIPSAHIGEREKIL